MRPRPIVLRPNSRRSVCTPGSPPTTSAPISTARSPAFPSGQRRREPGCCASRSGTNGARAKLRRLLADPAVRTVVVEHRDRLGRMNVELVEAALSASGRSLVVLDLAERDDDLVRDMTEVLTSFCARLYGRRSLRNRAVTGRRCFESPNVNTNASAPDRKARFRTDDRRWDPVAGATGTSAARRGGWTPRASPSLPTA